MRSEEYKGKSTNAENENWKKNGMKRNEEMKSSSSNPKRYYLPGNLLLLGGIKTAQHGTPIQLPNNLPSLNRRLNNRRRMTRLHPSIPNRHTRLLLRLRSVYNHVSGKLVPADMGDQPDLDVALGVAIDVLSTEALEELFFEKWGGFGAAVVAFSVRADHDGGFGEPPVGEEGCGAGVDFTGCVAGGVVEVAGDGGGG